MKITDCSKALVVATMTLILLPCAITTSCIKDAQDEPPTPPAADSTTYFNDSTLVVIDSSYTASAEYMHGEWMAQYVGYDPRQMVNSAIRRLVFFSPDGFYDSHIQGIVNIDDTITSYKEFEHEHGTYTFSVGKQTMTYTIEYDSLLNFGSDQLEYYPGKSRPGAGLIREYQERVWFSKENESRRDWIRTDENLLSTVNHDANVVYIMKKQQ